MKKQRVINTETMLNEICKKVTVFYQLPSSRNHTEDCGLKRLNTIISNNYKYYGVVVTDLETGKQYHEQAEFYGDDLEWLVL